MSLLIPKISCELQHVLTEQLLATDVRRLEEICKYFAGRMVAIWKVSDPTARQPIYCSVDP